jgi:hypothetical protein
MQANKNDKKAEAIAKAEKLQRLIADAALALPQAFTAGKHQLYIYPATLGSSMIIQSMVADLPINRALYKVDSDAEKLRLVRYYRSDIANIVAKATLATKKEHADPQLWRKRAAIINEYATDEELAAMFDIVIDTDHSEPIIEGLGIDREQDQLREINRVKESRSKSVTKVYGGHSVFGLMLDRAAERYGWTKDYIMWGIDYTSLKLMLTDSLNSVYMSADEAKAAGVSADDTVIDMTTREGAQRFREMMKGKH